ncbi:MAG TPA: DUF6627 family protein, partial [Gammaproteobacteria bacterium]|nr:DUF6627 family protein [Gammaproteobacteria bacterium]
PVQAAPVSTGELLHSESQQVDRARLQRLLEREDVADRLQALGVDPEQAKQRVANLSAEEIRMLNQRLGELPAGGDVLGIVVLFFLVFIITDSIGATDIFPFVDPVT